MKNTKILRSLFFIAVVLLGLMTGCSKDEPNETILPLAIKKALTAYSFSPAIMGTIDETKHTIAVTIPADTNVTAMLATFITTGASVKVGSVAQVSGTTPNNFTSPVTYTVTAKDGSTQNYVVTVTVTPYVNIPDANFREHLKTLIPKAFGGTEGNQLNTKSSEVLNLKELNLLYKNIDDLTGIEYFTGLTNLSCSHNSITTLDVSKNKALEHLNCSDNGLTSLDVTKNTALTSLLCSYNQIVILDVGKNTALFHLDCSSNELTSLDVSKNTALENLVCYYNNLTLLDISKNTALKFLMIDPSIKCSHPSIKIYRNNTSNTLHDESGHNIDTYDCP